MKRLGKIGLGLGLIVWTILPVYNMILIALDNDADEYTGRIWPSDLRSTAFA